MGNQQTTHRAGEPSYAPPGAMAALDDVQAGWNAGAGPWNPDALAQLYMEDALLFGGRPHMSVGRSGIREYFASYSHIFVSIRLELVDQHILALAPDVFATQGFGLFAFQLTDGRSTRSRMRTPGSGSARRRMAHPAASFLDSAGAAAHWRCRGGSEGRLIRGGSEAHQADRVDLPDVRRERVLRCRSRPRS